MKKIMQLTAAVLAVALLAACGNVGDVSESSAQNTSNAAAETLPQEGKSPAKNVKIGGIENSKRAVPMASKLDGKIL